MLNMLYRHTFTGLISIMYSKMKQRHIKNNYNKICDKNDFIEFAQQSEKLKILYNDWVNNNFDRRKTPTVDRINNSIGYEFNNIQFLTKSENSAKGNKETKINKTHPPYNVKKVRLFKNDEEYFFDNGKLACDFLNVSRYAVSNAIIKKHKIKGWNVEYVTETKTINDDNLNKTI